MKLIACYSRLNKAFKPVDGEYDIVLLDCPPNLSLLSENVFKVADRIVVPVIPTTLSQRTLEQLYAFFMTFKRGQGLVRDEAEIKINESDFHHLWPLTQDRQVEKQRSKAPLENSLTAEIDEFSGALAGLLLCEVEFGDPAQARAFVPPQWFGADVTEDGRYKNKSLAENGIPEN